MKSVFLLLFDLQDLFHERGPQETFLAENEWMHLRTFNASRNAGLIHSSLSGGQIADELRRTAGPHDRFRVLPCDLEWEKIQADIAAGNDVLTQWLELQTEWLAWKRARS